MSFETSHTRWQAVTSRLRAADGHFVYAVKTTNIYCRPTCPARLARRANVDFYRLARDAEAAGYRPCKRCKPENAGLEEDGQGEVVQKACVVLSRWARDGGRLSEHKENGSSIAERKRMGLNELAMEVGKTPRYLHKIFKERMGVTPKQYAKQMEEMYHPPTSPSSDTTTTTPTMNQFTAIDSGLAFDFNDFEFDLEWHAGIELDQVDAQTAGPDVFQSLMKDASLSPESALKMPMTPSDLSDGGLWSKSTDALIGNAQDLPALSSTALDGLLADAILSHQNEGGTFADQSAPDGLADWVWEAEWSNAVIDSYQRSAAIL